MLAVEIRQYVGAGVQTLVPSVITTRRESILALAPSHDTENTFFEKLHAQAGPERSKIGSSVSEYDWRISNAP